MVSEELVVDRKLAARLPITWPVFFQKWGRLTAIQRETIEPVLDGASALISASTAAGKTESACAPLVERLMQLNEPWLLLYVSPTRALVNDLYARLECFLPQTSR